MPATPSPTLAGAGRGRLFTAVHTVGALLPADMLARIAEGRDVKGAAPADYRVIGRRSVRDEAERHWDYLKGAWQELREKLPLAPEAAAPADTSGLAVAGWLLPLFDELGFGLLTPVGPAGIAAADGGKTFPISHRWRHLPIHIAPWHASLDKRPGGAGTVPPHSLVQECLNRTEAHLWAILTNGRQLRLLRDSSALATASYVEFDLEAIFDGELFSEFVLLYRLLHATRFEVAPEAPPSNCWLETWRTEAIASGTRALDTIRDGVQQAITTLGTGFLRHPDNAGLRETLDVDALHKALLRLAYRMIFLFVTEDRGALLDPEADPVARERYERYFSTARLRRHARRRRGTAHGDLYRALRVVLDALSDENGRPELGLPGLGGIFDEDPTSETRLGDLSLSNEYLLTAVRHLAQVRDAGTRRWRPVDYRNMGAEELGSIYESLLELVPKHSAVDRTFELVNRLGNDRKKTGSYYTPTPLIDVLLDSTLDPVIDEAVKRGEQRATAAGDPDAAGAVVAELLSLKVCDPACGSGHFLVAAARRIAKRVAAVREHNPEPTPAAVQHALHEVVARCVYGVDLNPMAVELAKVSLWLEAMEPGKALSFLDAHIKLGNGLIGATPALMRDGIPDAAFKPVEGDRPEIARALAKRNAIKRGQQLDMFDPDAELRVANTAFATELAGIVRAPGDRLKEVRTQAARYRDWQGSEKYVRALHLANAWCAAFMWHKTKDAPPVITDDVFRALHDPAGAAAPQATHDEIVRLTGQYRFFHWHLEFPDVFRVPEDGAGIDPSTGWAGGFDCVLGNPPWDKVDFEDKKYFSVTEPAIANIAGTARRTRIAEWTGEHPGEGERYFTARRTVKSSFLFFGSSGAYPLCGKGLTIKGVNSLQTDQLFAERFSTIVDGGGRFGCIVPTAIATGAGAQHLFKAFTRRGAVRHLYDFENRKPIFIGVDSRYKFCLLSLTGSGLSEPVARFAFFLHDATDLDDAERIFALAPEEIALINPNTGTLPIFRTRRDADLTLRIHSRIPVLWNEQERAGNPWQITFKSLFHMTDDSDLFRTREQLEGDGWQLDGNVFVRGAERMLPLYEGKMAHLYDHRWNSYFGRGNEDRRRVTADEKDTPHESAIPRYWIAKSGRIPTRRRGINLEIPGVDNRLGQIAWDHNWLCGWRDVCRTTDERTAIPVLLPPTAVGHTFSLMLPRVDAHLVAVLIAAQSSLVYDFVARQKISDAHMKLFIWKQLPVPAPASLQPHLSFVVPRVLELVYTAHDMAALARDLGDATDAQPFRWDEDRRAVIRAELDAYFFHLYGISREDTDYILETFQTENGGLKHNEIARYGTYRTKDLLLAEYDRMAPSGVSLETPLVDGETYTSTLTPPPGHGPRHPPAP